MPTLHLHFDEAGDWNFNPKGSAHYVLTIAYTYDPLPLAQELAALRYSMNKVEGVDIPGFHANPDPWPVRLRAINCMTKRDSWRFAGVVLEKRKVHPSLRRPEKFYPQFAGTLLKFVLRGRDHTDPRCVLTYADTLPINTKAKREGVLKAMKTTCAAELAAGTPHHVFAHSGESNAWLQVADYCCWGLYRKWEHGRDDGYNLLKGRLQAPELVITAPGTTTYY